MPRKTLRLSRAVRRAAGRQPAPTWKKLLLWAAAAALLLLVQLLSFNLLWRSPAQSPAGAAPVVDEAAPEPDSTPYYRFLQSMLGYNIAGLGHTTPADRQQLAGLALDAFRSLAGVDPRDPRSYLQREIGLSLPWSIPALAPVAEPGDPHAGPGGETDTPPAPSKREPSFFFPFPFKDYYDPLILLYHTHASESFVPSSGVWFSDDLEQTVVRLGDELARLLQDNYGLPLMHDRSIYDLPRREDAYAIARPPVRELLVQNPQVRLAIDLHRDGVARAVTTTLLQGLQTGKILLVVGTQHEGWETNYEFALRLHHELEAVAPGLSRGIRRYPFVYNQDLHPRSLLIEVGGHENTMEEAMRAIPYVAEALARAYYIFFVED